MPRTYCRAGRGLSLSFDGELDLANISGAQKKSITEKLTQKLYKGW